MGGNFRQGQVPRVRDTDSAGGYPDRMHGPVGLDRIRRSTNRLRPDYSGLTICREQVMKMPLYEAFVMAFIAGFLGFLFGSLAGALEEGKTIRNLHEEAVSRGYGEHVVVNGGPKTEFRWKDEP